jgi:hypothetical protein
MTVRPYEPAMPPFRHAYARQGSQALSRSLPACGSGNPGSLSFQFGNVLNLLRFVADQQMSRWSSNETKDAMKHAIIVVAALLASALSAHAAPVKKHLRVVSGQACHDILCHSRSRKVAGHPRRVPDQSESDMLNQRNWVLGIFN